MVQHGTEARYSITARFPLAEQDVEKINRELAGTQIRKVRATSIATDRGCHNIESMDLTGEDRDVLLIIHPDSISFTVYRKDRQQA